MCCCSLLEELSMYTDSAETWAASASFFSSAPHLTFLALFHVLVLERILAVSIYDC